MARPNPEGNKFKVLKHLYYSVFANFTQRRGSGVKWNSGLNFYFACDNVCIMQPPFYWKLRTHMMFCIGSELGIIKSTYLHLYGDFRKLRRRVHHEARVKVQRGDVEAGDLPEKRIRGVTGLTLSLLQYFKPTGSSVG